MRQGLKLVLYDDTCRTDIGWGTGLTHTWIAGKMLYRARGVIDDAFGVTSWAQALEWLVARSGEQDIREVQYWGHGKWGRAFVGEESLDVSAFEPDHPLHDALMEVRDRMADQRALWWFRTCETIGGHAGQAFATAWTHHMRSRVAGHTTIIGPWQSGLHMLAPGTHPQWSPQEGIIEGTAEAPLKARWSTRTQPRTVSALRASVPSKWWV